MDFDTRVKLTIYETIARSTRVPDASDLAAALQAPLADIKDALERLRLKRLLVLEPADPSRIRMAPPFSGIKTPHVTIVDGKSYYANCAWDALGVAAALHQDADIFSTCADCGEQLTYAVRHRAPVPRPCAVHFPVPAAHWWDDIIYT